MQQHFPMTLASLVHEVHQQCTTVAATLQSEWVAQCVEIIDSHREGIEFVMPEDEVLMQ